MCCNLCGTGEHREFFNTAGHTHVKHVVRLAFVNPRRDAVGSFEAVSDRPVQAISPPHAVVQLQIAETIEDIRRIQAEWDRLLEQSDVAPVFLNADWVIEWLETFGTRVEPLVLLARIDGRLVAVLPLAVRRRWIGPLLTRRLEWIGTGEADYLDVVVYPRFREEALEALVDALERSHTRWDVCILHDISATSRNVDTLVRLLRKEHATALVPTWPCPYLVLRTGGGWPGAAVRKSGKFVKNLRRDIARLDRVGTVTVKRITSQPELVRILPQLAAIHRRRWAKYHTGTRFGTPLGEKFYLEIACKYLERGWLELTVLYVGNAIAAFSYSFLAGGTYYYYIPAYEPLFATYSPGSQLLYSLLREAEARGVQLFDLMKGDEQYKTRWTDRARRNVCVVASARSARGWIARVTYELESALVARARASVRIRRLVAFTRKLGVPSVDGKS